MSAIKNNKHELEQIEFIDNLLKICGYKNISDYKAQISIHDIDNIKLDKINQQMQQFKKIFPTKQFNLSRINFKLSTPLQAISFLKNCLNHINQPYDITVVKKKSYLHLLPIKNTINYYIYMKYNGDIKGLNWTDGDIGANKKGFGNVIDFVIPVNDSKIGFTVGENGSNFTIPNDAPINEVMRYGTTKLAKKVCFNRKIDVNVDDIKYYDQQIIKQKCSVQFPKINKLHLIGDLKKNIWVIYLVNLLPQYKYKLCVGDHILITSELYTEHSEHKYYNKQYFSFDGNKSDILKVFTTTNNNKIVLDIGKTHGLYIDVINNDPNDNYHVYNPINNKFMYDEYILDIIDCDYSTHQLVLKPNNTFKNSSPRDYCRLVDGFVNKMLFDDMVVMIINNKYITKSNNMVRSNDPNYKHIVDGYTKDSNEYHYIVDCLGINDGDKCDRQLFNFNDMNNIYFVTNNKTNVLKCDFSFFEIYYDMYYNDGNVMTGMKRLISF